MDEIKTMWDTPVNHEGIDNVELKHDIQMNIHKNIIKKYTGKLYYIIIKFFLFYFSNYYYNS